MQRILPIDPTGHLVRGLLFGMALVLVGGCSSIQIAYSLADNAIENRAEDYLILTEEEERKVASQVSALIAWHRSEMLPRYAAFLQSQSQVAANGGWTRSQMADGFSKFRSLLDETVKGAAPYFAEVLADHTTDHKLAYLKARMNEKLAERVAEMDEMSAKERVERIADRRARTLARFVGSLDETQSAIIKSYTEKGMQDSLRWLENRRQRQDALVSYLGQAPERMALSSFLYRLLMRPYEITDPGYQAVSERRWALLEGMYFEVLQTLSGDDLQDVSETLLDYAQDLTELSGASDQASAY